MTLPINIYSLETPKPGDRFTETVYNQMWLFNNLFRLKRANGAFQGAFYES